MKKITAKYAVLAIITLLIAASSGCGSQTSSKNQKNQTIFEAAPLKKVTVGDIDIAYKEFGKGEPLVMITGYSTTMDTWEPQFLEDLAAKYRVIVFDNRGMGETTPGNTDWTMDLFGDDTAGLIEALKLGRANVLGWSIGGDIALSLITFHPENVKKLISYAGDCGGTEKVDAPPYKETLAKLNGVKAPGKNLFASLFPPEWMEQHPLFIKDFPIPKELTKPKYIALQNQAYEDWQGVYDELPGDKTPVLAATGTEDVSTPPENATILQKRLPNIALVEFEGAGHGLQYQYPNDFARVIIDFLASPPVKGKQPTQTIQPTS